MKIGMSSAVVRLISSSKDLCVAVVAEHGEVKGYLVKDYSNCIFAICCDNVDFFFYLCHVRESEIAVRALLVFLNNFEKFLLPLHGHFKFGVVAGVVIEGEGSDQSLSVCIVVTWSRKKTRRCSNARTF